MAKKSKPPERRELVQGKQPELRSTLEFILQRACLQVDNLNHGLPLLLGMVKDQKYSVRFPDVPIMQVDVQKLIGLLTLIRPIVEASTLVGGKKMKFSRASRTTALKVLDPILDALVGQKALIEAAYREKG